VYKMGIYRNWKMIKAGINYRKKISKLKQEFLQLLNEKQILLLNEINKRESEKNNLYILILSLSFISVGFVFGWLLRELLYVVIEILQKIGV